MNYRNIIITATLALGLSGCVGVDPGGKGYNITVPMSAINTTVASNFPQKQKTSYGTLKIEKPNVLAKVGQDKLGVGTSFVFSNMLIPNGVKGSANISSGLKYNASNKGIYLNNPMVENIVFQNFSLSQYITPQMKSAIGQVIAKTIAKKPIYNLGSNMASSFVKGVKVDNGNVVATVGM